MRSPSERTPLTLDVAVRLLPKEVREEILGDLVEKWNVDVRERTVGARFAWLARQPAIALGLRLRHWRTNNRPEGFLPRGSRLPRVSLLDVRLGLRMLRRQPVLSLVAGLTLAVGIPAGLFPIHMAGVFNQSLPVSDGERIRVIRYLDPQDGDYVQPNLEDLERWKQTLQSFESLGAASIGATFNLALQGRGPAPVQGSALTASVFEMLRVSPALGRPLNAADELPGAAAVAVIGHDLWRSRFAANPEIVGTTLELDGIDHTVVGVMPEGFQYPYRDQLWVPLRDPTYGGGVEAWDGESGLVFGRLAERATIDEAQLEIASEYQVARPVTAESVPDLRPEVVSFGAGIFNAPAGGYHGAPEFYSLQFLFVLVLLVACANVGMLTLARIVTRSSEIALRTALGASRARIVSQLFVETLVLALLAAGLGLLVADRILVPAMGWLFDQGPAWLDLGVKPWTAVWAALLAALSAAVIGIVPALKATGPSVRQNIQRASEGSSGVRFGHLSNALLVGDVALAVGVLGMAAVLAGGLGESARDVSSIPAEQILFAELSIPRAAATDAVDMSGTTVLTGRSEDTRGALLRRLREEQGVIDAALGSSVIGLRSWSSIELDDGPSGAERRHAMTADVDPHFMATLRQPILAGRDFVASDAGENGRAVIVNSTFVEETLGGANAVGRRLRYLGGPEDEPGPWHEIIGVVDDIGMNESSPEPQEGVYRAAVPTQISPSLLVVRLAGDPEAFTPTLRELARAIDPTAMVSDTQRLDKVMVSNRMVWLSTLGGIGTGVLILVALSAAGIYALMSLTVTQRRKEIGIRVALGARRADIARLVGTRAIAQVGAGVLLGLPFAWVMLRRTEAIHGMSSAGVLSSTLILSSSTLLLISIIACTTPTMRALRISPGEAIGEE